MLILACGWTIIHLNIKLTNYLMIMALLLGRKLWKTNKYYKLYGIWIEIKIKLIEILHCGLDVSGCRIVLTGTNE